MQEGEQFQRSWQNGCYSRSVCYKLFELVRKQVYGIVEVASIIVRADCCAGEFKAVDDGKYSCGKGSN